MPYVLYINVKFSLEISQAVNTVRVQYIHDIIKIVLYGLKINLYGF